MAAEPQRPQDSARPDELPERWSSPAQRGLIDEAARSDLPKEVQRAFKFIIGTRERPLTKSTLQDLFRQRVARQMAGLEYLFSLPPPYSMCECNMDGEPRATVDTTRFLLLLDEALDMRDRRSLDGFERRIQQTQIRFSDINRTDTARALGVSRPGFWSRMLGRGGPR